MQNLLFDIALYCIAALWLCNLIPRVRCTLYIRLNLNELQKDIRFMAKQITTRYGAKNTRSEKIKVEAPENTEAWDGRTQWVEYEQPRKHNGQFSGRKATYKDVS